MKTLKLRLACLVVLLLGLTMNICAQTTYVFHTISRSALPITVTVNGHIYKLTKTCEYPKPNDGTCLTVNVQGNMSWYATDCDGDRITKYDRGQTIKDGRKIVYIKIMATTKIHKQRINSSNSNYSNNTYSNRNYSSSSSGGSFKSKLADGLAGLATQAIGNLMSFPSLSEMLISRANNGDPDALDTYGKISFWGAQNTWAANTYEDIPANNRVTINCLIENNHNYIPYLKRCYEHDAEIGFMWGRGFGVEINLEEADRYFQQAYERANDSIRPIYNNMFANLAKADVLIQVAQKDTLEALDLIAAAMNTSSENILNGNLPKQIRISEEHDPKDPFDCMYSGGTNGVISFISLSSSLDLGNILWYGCKSFEPNKEAALQVFRRIKDANAKEDGMAQLQLANALIDIYNDGYREREILDLILESGSIAAQCKFQHYRSNAAYSLATVYMFAKAVRDLDKAELYLKEAKKYKSPTMKAKVKKAYADLKILKKESHKK